MADQPTIEVLVPETLIRQGVGSWRQHNVLPRLVLLRKTALFREIRFAVHSMAREPSRITHHANLDEFHAVSRPELQALGIDQLTILELAPSLLTPKLTRCLLVAPIDSLDIPRIKQ